MSHYFEYDDNLGHDKRKIECSYGGVDFSFTTDIGVFSREHMDPATDILLRTIPPLSGSLLDLGCGWGCIGIILAKLYSLKLTQSDINPRALELTRQNCGANGVRSEVVCSDCFDNIPGSFDAITLNPPIHAGKSVTYRMFEEAAGHIVAGGRLFVVTLKKHGAESTEKKLREVFGGCETLYRKKGYYVFSCGVEDVR